MAAQWLDIDRSTPAGATGQGAALLDPVLSRIRDAVLSAELPRQRHPVSLLAPVRGKTAIRRLRVSAVEDRALGSPTSRATWYRFTSDRIAARSQLLKMTQEHQAIALFACAFR